MLGAQCGGGRGRTPPPRGYGGLCRSPSLAVNWAGVAVCVCQDGERVLVDMGARVQRDMEPLLVDYGQRRVIGVIVGGALVLFLLVEGKMP